MLSTDTGLMRYTRGTGLSFHEIPFLSRDATGMPIHRRMVPLQDGADAAQVSEHSACKDAT